jgi:integrase
MPLTDTAIRQAKPAEKPQRLFDGGGLYLEVAPAGGKWWRLKYRFGGKEKRLSLGTYPGVSLAAARRAALDAKQTLSTGLDPSVARKLDKLRASHPEGETFKVIALEWHSKKLDDWSTTHFDRTLSMMERDLFPWIGDRHMAEIEPMELLAVLQKIEERGALDAADRALSIARQVWEYWLPTAGKAHRNITEGLKKRLRPHRSTNYPAILEPKRFGDLLRGMHAYKGGVLVRTALLLAPILFQRPGNLRMMEWSELDLDAGLWTIPSAKMKRTREAKVNGEPHVVPLPTQAIELLRNVRVVSGRGRYVFPGQRQHDQPMSDNSVRCALFAIGRGKEQSWHGFRASARTMLVDQLDMDPLAIEANLAHMPKDANGRSYNRTKYLAQRFQQIQAWADYLDSLRLGADVLQFKAA